MDKTKIRDITIRVFAVLISLILWMYVTTVQNPEIQTEIASIPVKLVNIEALSQAGLVMLGSPDAHTIKLSIKGRSKDVLQITPKDFTVEANLGNGYRVKGVNSILVELKEHPKDIEIPNQPIYISVELDELVQRNFPVAVKVEGGTQDGYATLPASVKPNEVILKGAAKYIGSVHSVVAKVDLKGSMEDIQTSMPVQILDKDGKSVPNIECIPNTVDIVVPVKKAREIPINVKTSGRLPDGVFLVDTAAIPDKVDITGDDRVVSALKSIDTAPVSLDGINSSTTRQVRLNLPPGVIMIDKIETVNVDIMVETTISKSFNVQVNYTNLPGGLTADLLTNTINVILSGQESVINRVIASDITAVIDLGSAQAEDGEYEFTPKLTFPEGLSLKDVVPPKIKVKITKKQG